MQDGLRWGVPATYSHHLEEVSLQGNVVDLENPAVFFDVFWSRHLPQPAPAWEQPDAAWARSIESLISAGKVQEARATFDRAEASARVKAPMIKGRSSERNMGAGGQGLRRMFERSAIGSLLGG